MYCCDSCFNSKYLRDIIQSDPRIGDCDYCDSKDVSVYEPRELIHFFSSILNLYEVSEGSEKGIVALIKEDFEDNIFSDSVKDVSNLLFEISKGEPEDYIALFENNVASINQREETANQVEEIHNIWDKFKDEIKNVNRFHINNAIDLQSLETLFKDEAFHSKIMTGKIFYRSRIATDPEGHPDNKMGHPPAHLATSGRANPKGISYLYVADEAITSIYEARASLFDYVCVAEFKLIENLKVLNLRQPIYDPISWAEKEAIEDYLVYVPFIKTLQKELSLPIRSKDKEIDYLPTQYLSEFIKSLGFDGVEFQSSLRKEGYNLAIFNPEKLIFNQSCVYEISNIDLTHDQL